MIPIEQFTEDQRQAFDGAIRRIDAGEKLIQIQGKAGTGKSTVLLELGRRYYSQDVFLTAMWGVAAYNLRIKAESAGLGALEVLNVHRAMKKLRGEDDKGRPVFKETRFHRKLILLDESSVVGKSEGAKLLEHCDQLVTFGDKGQLPPVNEEPFFTGADFTLNEVVRQAKDSAIISEANSVREGNAYTDWAGDDAFFVSGDISNRRFVHGVDMAIVPTNDDRRKVSAVLRETHGFGITRMVLHAGERLMCRRNDTVRDEEDEPVDIWNGSVYIVLEDWEKGNPLKLFTATGETILCSRPAIEDWAHRDKQGINFIKSFPKGIFQLFQLGYATTCEKSQGGEWPHVVIFDPGSTMSPEKYSRWMYTAITRGQKRVTIYRGDQTNG